MGGRWFAFCLWLAAAIAAPGAEEYPRPQLVRLAGTGAAEWQALDRGPAGASRFTVPEAWAERRVLLHVRDAVGEVSAELNGTVLLPVPDAGGISFEISAALRAGGEQLLKCEGGGMLWIEPVPESRVVDAYCVPDIDTGSVTLHVDAELSGTALLKVGVRDERDREVASAQLGVTYGGADLGLGQQVSTAVKLPLPNAHLWGASPYLYGFRIELKRDGERVDRVEGPFGMRKIGVVGKAVARNNAPMRWVGLEADAGDLPAPAAIEAMGFDFVRVTKGRVPGGFYSECDRLGLMVWQEIDAGDGLAMRTVLAALRRHPSVVIWEPKPNVASVHRWLRRNDPERLTAGGALGDVVIGAGAPEQVTMVRVEVKAEPAAYRAALERVSTKGGGAIVRLDGSFAESGFPAVREINWDFADRD